MATSDPQAVLASLTHLLYETEKASVDPAFASLAASVSAPPASVPPAQAGGAAGGGARAAAEASLEYGITATALPVDRISSTVLFSGVLKGGSAEDMEQRRRVRGTQVLLGIYAGDAPR